MIEDGLLPHRHAPSTSWAALPGAAAPNRAREAMTENNTPATIRILVIEDTAKHVADAKTHAAQLVGCEVDYATSLEEALALLTANRYDGAISDVFFPERTGGSAETFENAVAISTKLVELGIHHVFNTSGNHHGSRYREFVWKTPRAFHNENKYHFLTTGMVIEAYPQDSNGEKDAKQWQAAFRYILLVHALLKLPDEGVSILGDEKRSPGGGFPYGDYGDLTGRFAACTHPFVLEVFRTFNA